MCMDVQMQMLKALDAEGKTKLEENKTLDKKPLFLPNQIFSLTKGIIFDSNLTKDTK